MDKDNLIGVRDGNFSAAFEKYMERHGLVPVKFEGGFLYLAVPRGTDIAVIDHVRAAAGGRIRVVYLSRREMEKLRPQFRTDIYSLPGDRGATLPGETAACPGGLGLGEKVPTNSDMAALFYQIVHRAVAGRATDIHLEPGQQGLRVRFRVDGLLLDFGSLPRKWCQSLVSVIKVLSGMDIAQSRLPQDGRTTVNYSGREIDLRVSTQPIIDGEKVVLRLLDRHGSLLALDGLGFSPANMKKLRQMMSQYGMILITGPTGSGKTTTMYAMIKELGNGHRNIMTVEDPVEYVLDGVNQTQVNIKAGLDFAVGLRAVLRQDPDVIMVGEIRDRETADLAIRAAGTGHLVLSTLHTGDAAGALTRLKEMGVEPYRVASSVIGAVAQRLARVLCPFCRLEYRVGESREGYSRPDKLSKTGLYTTGGCPRCNETGYRGQVGLQEVLVVDDEIRDLLGKGASSREIRNLAIKQGMKSLVEDGMDKARNGLTSVEEVGRVTGRD